MSHRAFVPATALLFLACQAGNIASPPVENHAPQAAIGAPAIGPEGSRIPFGTDGTSDPDGDALTFAWDFGDGVTLVTGIRTVSHVYRNNGSYVVRLVVSDSHGAADTAARGIIIANVAPQITLLLVPENPVVAGTLFRIEVHYADPGVDDTVHAMIWVWRPGGSGEGQGLQGPGIIERTFSDPDQYTIGVYVWDNDGASMERQADHPIIVVAAGTGAARYAVYSPGDR
jgi:hypothetical protein